jgi:excisionase family DNA binding protein
MQLTLGQAAKQVGVSKPTLSKAISTGKLSATRREDGSFAIDPAELCRYVEANGHRFHSATGNGSRLETPPDTAATTAATDAQVEALRQVEVLLRQELTDVRIDRDRWCAEASAWRDQAQAPAKLIHASKHGVCQMRSLSTSSAAKRMRLSRKRRREGTHFVRVQLDSTDIDDFIRLRLLRRAQRQDTEALQVAVRGLIYRVLEGAI